MTLIEMHGEATYQRDARDLLARIQRKIDRLSKLKSGLFNRRGPEAVFDRWACRAFEKIVTIEIQALARLRDELAHAQDDLKTYARATWFVWLDGLVAIRLKENFLELASTERGYRHIIADEETVEFFRLRIMPLLESGWNCRYEALCREVADFRVRISRDMATAVVETDLEKLIRLPTKMDWLKYQGFLERSGVM